MAMTIIAHAGVGTPVDHSDGPARAVQVAMDRLSGIVEPRPVEPTTLPTPTDRIVDAVTEAIVVMEDDPRFDCGLGSYMRLDGSIEMDAAIMDSSGRFGGVVGIYDVSNPVRVARVVLATPHNILCGRGAVDLARQFGFTPADMSTPASERRLIRVKGSLRGEHGVKRWAMPFKEFADRSGYIELFLRTDGRGARDTVGVVADDGNGNFAVAGSTGGTSYMLPGRVGDTAIPGAGLFAGPRGAVSVTGIGELIQQKVLAKAVYDLVASGEDVQGACVWGVEQLEPTVPVGVIAVGEEGHGIAANEEMASATLIR